MKDNRNRYNEEIEKYQSMDQFQVGIAVFDPDTTETQFYDNVRSVCEMILAFQWELPGQSTEKNLMRRSWKLTGGCMNRKMHIINSSRLHNRNCCNKCLKE